MFRLHRSLGVNCLSILVLTASLLSAGFAEARIGRSRSSGRMPSSSSYRQYSAPPRQAAPSSGYQYAPRSAGPNQGYQPPPVSQLPQQRSSGGFLRGMAGGLAGGFLGSMLYSTLGRAGGVSGGGVAEGPMGGFGGRPQGGSGFGIIEWLLLGGLLYAGYRFWQARQAKKSAADPYPEHAHWQQQVLEPSQTNQEPYASSNSSSRSYDYGTTTAAERISSDEANDIFFKMQGAWTRRDLNPVSHLIAADYLPTLEEDVRELRRAGRINRLENISLRGTDVVDARDEGSLEVSTVRFRANVLDYTVDESTGRVIEGSDSEPQRFQEDWVFTKPKGQRQWQLAGIHQS